MLMTSSFTCNQYQPSNDDIVRACVCVCVCCHVNSSGSQSLSITAVCSGGDTQPDFNITSAEWHLTQVCGCVFVLACACVLFYALSSFHFRLSPALKVTVRVCVCVCVSLRPTVILSFSTQPISSSNHSHLYFLFSSMYQLFQELKTQSSRYERFF